MISHFKTESILKFITCTQSQVSSGNYIKFVGCGAVTPYEFY